MNRVIPGPGYFPDPTIGRPVANGYIYVGDVDTDPTIVGNQKQISVLQEDTTTVQVAQPIRTSQGGVPVYNGSEVTILVDGNYSLTVQNKSEEQVSYIPSRDDLGDGTVDDLDDLKALTQQVDGETVYLKGRDSTGDGGQGHFYWDSSDVSTPVTNDTQSGVYVAPTSDATGASGAWVRLYGDHLDTRFFGTKGDDATDDTAALKGALAFVNYLLPLAQSLYMPAGKHIISSTIKVHAQGIDWYGEGGNYFFQNADQRNGTILKWAGGAQTVVQVTPDLTTRPIITPSIRNISIDGQSLAAVGLRIEACTQGIFKSIYVSHCLGKAVHTGESTLVGYTGLNFVHSCEFSNIGIDQVFATDGDGLILDGDNTTGASTTVCSFSDIHIRHYDGDGCRIDRGDNNTFFKLSVGRPTAGSGKGIVFSGTADAPSVNTNVMFYALGGEGGVHSESGVVNAVGNSIYGLSIDTDNPAPTVAAGSTLFYHQLFDSTDSTKTFGQNRIKIIGDFIDPIQVQGSHTYGMNLVDGTYSSAQIRLQNNSIVSARNGADSADIEAFRVSTTDELTPGIDMRMPDGKSLNFSTTTGSSICDTVTQKMAFWGVTPVVQQANIADTADADLNAVKDLLRTLGLMASP